MYQILCFDIYSDLPIADFFLDNISYREAFNFCNDLERKYDFIYSFPFHISDDDENFI